MAARPADAKRPTEGTFAITAEDASARGLPPWAIGLEQPEHFFDVGRDPAPPMFVSLSTPPGGAGFVGMSAVEGVTPSVESLKAYAVAHKGDAELRDPSLLEIAGTQRWVGHTVSAGMHGPLATTTSTPTS